MKKILLSLPLFLATGLTAQTYFSDDFEGGMGNWTLQDEDGDGNNWSIFDASANTNQGNVATSASWSNGTVLTPNNWMVAGPIDLSGITDDIFISWKAWGQDPDYPAEHYSVYAGTAGDVASFLAGTAVHNETLSSGVPATKLVDISAMAGSEIYIAFRHHNSSDEFRINIDDVKVYTPLNNDLELLSIEVNGAGVGSKEFSINVVNNGLTSVNSFDLEISFNGTVSTENITGVNLNLGDSYTYTFIEEINDPATINVSATITTSDDEMSNNSKSSSFSFINQVIPYTVTDIDGNDFDLYNQLSQGNMILLDFMASWCQPCLQSTPALSSFIENNGSGQGGIEAYAITVESDDNANVMNGLNWNGGYYEYPKIAYTSQNDNQFYHYAVNLGLNEGGYIPFFVLICPDKESPAKSTVVKYDVGYLPGMFNGYQPLVDQCLSTLDIVELPSNDFEFKVYPNPASNVLNVEFDLMSENEVNISIINSVGQTVSTKELGKVAGVQSEEINVSHLDAGIYVVKVSTKNGEKTQRITVL